MEQTNVGYNFGGDSIERQAHCQIEYAGSSDLLQTVRNAKCADPSARAYDSGNAARVLHHGRARSALVMHIVAVGTSKRAISVMTR